MRVCSQVISVLFLCFGQASPGLTEPDLEKAVNSYWKALLTQDKVTAVEFVHPDDRNNFLNRSEPLRQSFELALAELESETEAVVRVQVTQVVGGQSLRIPVTERWEKTELGWRVRVDSFRETFEKSMEAFRTNPPKMPEEVSLSPEILKIYKIARPTIGMIAVRNGLATTARILSLELDTRIFEIVRLPSEVQPASFEWIRIAYKGPETQENLKSRAVLSFELAGDREKLEIPIIYNYQDTASRWLTEGGQKQLQEYRKESPQSTPSKPPEPRH